MTIARRAAVIGSPIAHSRSPMIHGYWLEHLGILGSYERIEVKPGTLQEFLKRVDGQDLVGVNVTVPLKEEAFGLVDHAEDTARAVEAVNTVFREGGRLVGINTDIPGFLGNLDAGAPGWDARTKRVVLLGAGGAARGIAYGLKGRGAEDIAIVNRTFARAQEVAAHIGGPARACPEAELPRLLEGADLLVNATSLGMTGKPRLAIDLSPLPVDALVTDAVYVPLETELLAAARARGNPVIDGLGMLLHQAVPAFERFYGVRPTVTDELRARVVADIEGRR